MNKDEEVARLARTARTSIQAVWWTVGIVIVAAVVLVAVAVVLNLDAGGP